MSRKVMGFHSRYQRLMVESLEQRVLLTAYNLHQVALLNASDRGGIYGIAVDQQGDVLGTSDIGGTGAGTFFKISAGANAETVLSAVVYNDGHWPGDNLLRDSAGNIYANDDNGIYKLAPGSETVSTVALFSQSSGFPTGPGAGACSGLVMDSSGNLYGVVNGGYSGVGGIYEVAAGTDIPTMIASFPSNGYNPLFGLTIDSSGNLYGGTSGDGNNGFVYELAKGSSQITTLATFEGSQLNIGWPMAVDSSGNLYGVGGTSDGQEYVYELPVGSPTPVSIASFEGTYTNSGLSIDAQGDILGVAESGGSNGVGSVFEITPGSSSMTTIATIPGLNPAQSMDSLASDGHGDFYGVSYEGVVYELTPVDHLAFDNSPLGNVIAGQTLPPISVRVNDISGQVDTTSQSSVTLVLADSSGAVVQTYTATAQNGIATFTGIIPSIAGDCSLTASAAGITSSTAQPLTVTPAAASQLVFLSGPTSTIEGQSIGSIQVAIEDSFGNLVTTDQSPITLALRWNLLVTPDTGGSAGLLQPPELLGTVTVPPQDGVATFNDLSINTYGTYTLAASNGNFSPTASPAFTITGVPAQLVFLAQPHSVIAGTPVGPMIIAVEDAFGNVVTSDQSSVTLSLPQNGQITVPAQNGIAIFPPLTLSVGTYSFSASDGSLPVTPSNPITIGSLGEFLVFTEQPVDETFSGSLGTITVAVEDGLGNIETSDSSTITLSATMSGAPASLQGTLAIAVQNGVATFSNLSLSSSGTYTLAASDAESGSVMSNAFSISLPNLLPTDEVASFDAYDGAGPAGGLVMDRKGDLYGVTVYGGTNNDGTIFEIAAGTGSIQTLASFEGPNGAAPYAGLTIDAYGNLYGATSAGGAKGDGTLFALSKGSRVIKTLATFDGTDGDDARTTLFRDAAGDLFGTTYSGGSNDRGSLFELPKGAHTITTLYSFGSPIAQGPSAGLVADKQGNLYGATLGSADGTVPATFFEYVKSKHTFKNLATLQAAPDAVPWGPLVMNAAGDLFDVLQKGGANGAGAVVELAKGASTLTTVASFLADYGTPEGGLLIDSAGDLFGTYTDSAGTLDVGGIFEIKARSSTITLLAALNADTTGKYPAGDLTLAPNGTLYGAAYDGGAKNDGAIFSFMPPPPIPPAVKLLIQQQPAATAKNGTISLTVAVLDAKGKVITNGNFTLTLSLLKGPAAADFTPITLSTLNGIATFSDISLPAIAGTYTFAATEPLLKPVTAHPTVVKPLATPAHR